MSYVTIRITPEELARVPEGYQVKIVTLPVGAKVTTQFDHNGLTISYEVPNTPEPEVEIGYHGGWLPTSRSRSTRSESLRAAVYNANKARGEGFREAEAFFKRQIRKKIEPLPQTAFTNGTLNTHHTYWNSGWNECREQVLSLFPKDDDEKGWDDSDDDATDWNAIRKIGD